MSVEEESRKALSSWLGALFTRAWHEGKFSDEECAQTVRDYEAHLEAISARLPDPVVALVREVNLHDSVIESVEWAPAAARLALRLVTRPGGSNEAVSLTYSGVMLGERRLDVLRNVAAKKNWPAQVRIQAPSAMSTPYVRS